MTSKWIVVASVAWVALQFGRGWLTPASAAPAAPAAPAARGGQGDPPRPWRFFGRWDRRAEGRALTVNSGSYVLARFSGNGLAARFDLSTNQPPLPTLAWRIDEGEWQEAEIAPSVTLAGAPAPLGDGEHTLMLMARGLDEHQRRWSPPLVASITFLGLEPAPGGRLLDPKPEWDRPALKLEFLGDSITEGVLVREERPGKKTWPWRTDGRLAYPAQTAQRLGAAWRQVGFGATGVTHGGSGGAPSALESFSLTHAGCPVEDWQPDLVVINHGTNDGGAPADAFRPRYGRYLAMIRVAYPKAKIAAMRPFNGAHAADIRAEVESRHAAGDADVFYVDTTGWLGAGDFTDGLHPNVKGSTKAADKLADALRPATAPR